MPPIGRGFGSLVLDPSPRLRKLREEAESRDPVRKVWAAVRAALNEGVRSVERAIRSMT